MVELLCELHAHHNDGASVAHDAVRSHLVENLLAADSPLRLVVAGLPGDRVIGFAAISLVHSLVEALPEKRRQ